MASAGAASDVTDGPVVNLINKRIRNLRKKLTRIGQLEESIAQGRTAIKNRDQEELLKSKPTIIAAIDELEKFRQPLSAAVDEEINRAIEASENIIGKEVDHGDHHTIADKTPDDEQNPNRDHLLVLEDLLSLIYVGSMFDLKSQSDLSSIMLTRTHERNSCLMYDILGERDLDLISMMGSLLISRPMNSSFSHQNALQRCIQHAKLWLSKSEQPIDSNSDVTYAALREKLAIIIGLDFLKMTPEIKENVDVATEAAGNADPALTEKLTEITGSDFWKVMPEINANADVAAEDAYGVQVPVQVESSVPSHVLESKKIFKLPGHLCEDLIFEIFTRLPVKSLLRFRSLSKMLSSYIASPDFIRMHTFRSPQKILIQHKVENSGIPDFYTLHMKDQLPTDHTHYKGINPIAPPHNKYPQYVVGSCNGIICLIDGGNGITLWNPSIGRKLSLPDCRGRCSSLRPWECSCGTRIPTGIGFGFDPIMDDYKIVRLPKCGGNRERSYVYTMKTGAWCEITSSPTSFSNVTSHGCFLNGTLHWVVQRPIPEDYENEHYILTFDLSTHVFSKIVLPKPRWETKQLTIIQGSLTVISSEDHNHYFWEGNDRCIWVMREYNNADSWSVFSIENFLTMTIHRVLQPTSSSDLLLLETDYGLFHIYDPKVGAQSRLWTRYGDSYISEIEQYVESLQLFHMERASPPSVLKEKKRVTTQLKNSFQDLPSD